MRAAIYSLVAAVLFSSNGFGQTNAGPPDQWVTNQVKFPDWLTRAPGSKTGFESLHAEVLAERLKIFWTNAIPTNASVVAWISIEDFGHWPARDWRSLVMAPRGPSWETTVPVENLDTPIFYFVRAATLQSTNISVLRVCIPREAGLPMPTRFFWPYLEGFEEGTEGWWPLSATNGQAVFKTEPAPKTGLASLLVSVPADKTSATIGTTRIRGSRIIENGAKGLRLWLRTRGGEGRARFTLFAHAFSTNQTAVVSRVEAAVSNQWRAQDLAFADFPKLPLSEVDFFTIELIAPGPCEFLMDDVELVGQWKID
jgi:hypothetical protein